MNKFADSKKQTKIFHLHSINVNKTKRFFKNILAISSAFAVFLSNCPVYSVKAETVGAFIVKGGTLNTDYTFEGTSGTDGVLMIISSTPMTIQNTDPNTPTTDRIEINSEANLTLNGVNIGATDGAAMEIKNDAKFDVNIIISDNSINNLITFTKSAAGLQKNADNTSGTLTITGSTGENAGKLIATGEGYAAGIGGGDNESGSNITISGGTVTAIGGSWGAGIGSGSYGNASNITISGGTVMATGGMLGAGIGSGNHGNASNITISGGTVMATGGTLGAGIGGGAFGNGSSITISGGNLTVIGGKGTSHGAAGIGSGDEGWASNNSLNGNAVVIVTSGDSYKPALEGFDEASGIVKGIVFQKLESDANYTGTIYGEEVTIKKDVTFPANLTISADNNKMLIVDNDVELTIPDNVTLTIEKYTTLRNCGTLTETGTINFIGNGTVETEIIYNENYSNDIKNKVEYKTYLDSSGIKTYGDLPIPTREGYDFEGWYTEETGGEQIKEDTEVMPNLHVLYAHWEGNGNQAPEPTPNPTPGEKPNGWNSEGFSWNYIDNEINSSEIQKPESKPNETIKMKTLRDIQNEIPERLKNIAYIKGYEDGTFKPNNNITRAEAAAMLYRLIYDGTQIDINILYQYNDVEKNNWSTAAIVYLTQHGIMQGFDGEFRPDDKITRAEFAKIVYESLLKYNINENSKLIYGENEFRFSDVKNDWTFEPIKQLATNEMINGYGNDLFKPNENIARAEAVKIINKAFGRNESWIGSISFNDVSENHWAYEFIMNAANDRK